MVHELLVWLVEHTDYRMPSVEPDLERLSAATIAEMACGKGSLLCPVVGMHYTGSYNIFIREGLDLVNSRHVALHELVHYLQSRANPNLGGCARLEHDENEAYALQYLFRVTTQQYVGPPPPTQIFCGPTDAP